MGLQKCSRRFDHQRQSFWCEELEGRLLLSGSPTINTVTPVSGATSVALNADVEATVNLPNGGIDPKTVNPSNVYLFQTAFPNNNSKYVPADVKTTGGGDALILSPQQNLLPNTSYTFVVTSGLQDVHGDAFAPFTETFTTGNTQPAVSSSYAFSQTALPTTQGYPITDVQIGPDGNLWASTEVGQILRFGINADGTLSAPQVITSLQTLYGGNRLITGFAFDPSFVANPSSPMIWVSNTYYALSGATNAPNFTGSLTVMSGTNLDNVKDAIVDLPRSVADHVNDQPVFQPGTHNLFFCQAGLNASGAPDATWGNRSETLLSAAILEVNTSALNLSGPALNVLTPDAGGTYNPSAAGAPLTIYATGIRNAYELLFDDKGTLWAVANGSSSGGNAPAGNGAPALNNIQQVEEDTMINVVQGAYYGHPNPARSQYVLDQGNPATGAIPGLAFTEYPVGTNPEANYKLPNYIFGLHSSPDGIIQYQGNAFGGSLNGKFLVAEYSAPDDIVVLSRDASDDVIGGLASSAITPAPDRSVSGFQQLNSPVSLIEDNATGFIYVSQLGASNLLLLKPAMSLATIGRGAAKSVRFTNDAGTVTTISLNGPGTATIQFAGNGLSQSSSRSGIIVTGTGTSIASITLTGTRASGSTLVVTTKGGPKSVSIGGISADGSLAAINAPTAALSGPLSIAASVGKIALGPISSASITAGGSIGTLQAPEMSGTSVSAAVIRTMRIKGALGNSTLTLSGTGNDLAGLTAGSISNVQIKAAGSIGSVTATSLSNSQVVAGSGASDPAGFPPVAAFARTAVINSVHVKSMSGSAIAASRIQSVSLGSVQTSNGGVPFGIESQSVNRLSLVNPQSRKVNTFTKLTSPATVTAQMAKANFAGQDFEVDLV